MATPMKITDEMRDAHSKRVDEFIEDVNRRIKYAVENGKHDACFPVDKNDADYSEVKKLFEAEGYHIKPTGYIGGVWQLTEDICW